MSTLSITHYAGTELPAVSAAVTRGEPFVISLEMLESGGDARDTSGGTVSFSWERRGNGGSPIQASASGSAEGTSTITVPASATLLLDGTYQFDLWYTPLSGDPEHLIAKSSWVITTAIGPSGVLVT
jgi:hypothetical protein